jgi:hypothetical protein
VAKVLSGLEPTDASWIPTLSTLDDVLPMVREFCGVALRLDTTPDVPEFRFHKSLVDVFGAVLIYHSPDMLKLARDGPYPRTVRTALAKLSLTENDLVSWSLALRQSRMDQSTQQKSVSHHAPGPQVPSDRASSTSNDNPEGAAPATSTSGQRPRAVFSLPTP